MGIGVKASNYFMPAETLSDKGPGGGGWIHFNKYMQVQEAHRGWRRLGRWYLLRSWRLQSWLHWRAPELRDAPGPEDLLPGRGAGHARHLEPREDRQGQGAEAHLVAVGCRHVRHKPGPPRRVLRRGRQREQGLRLHGQLV